MVDSFIIEMHLIGMALGNSILVFPRFQKDKIKYRQLSIVTASVAIALSFTTIILMIFAFGGPMRLLERLTNPAPQAITLQIFFGIYYFTIYSLSHSCSIITA